MRQLSSCFAAAVVAGCLIGLARGADDDGAAPRRHRHYVANRPPLVAKPYAELPLGAIKPAGWLRERLEAMAGGMTGHLDDLYPEVLGRRNGWLGGDGDGWERGPYWIDGLLPLAYLLDDAKLKAKVRPWIEWTLTHQAPDGYLGPVPFEKPPKGEPGLQRGKRRDWWPKMVMLKILENYYGASGDDRVIECLSKYFRYQLRELDSTPLGHWSFWGNRRGGDNLLVVLWLYNVSGDEQLLELAELVHSQTYRHTEEWLKPDGPLARFRGMHCVNVAQGMKHPAVYHQLHPEGRHLEAVAKAFSDLDRHWGMPTGLFGADEPLNSKEPTTGSELCTAVEMMFSLEKMVEITGEAAFADRLERIAFNVLPTQVDDDFTGRQYYSLVNQVVCARRKEKAHLTDHEGTDVVYGLLTGYPCCTTNMHQGWPKLVQHLWYASADDGLAALVYAPCTVAAKVADGTEVSITEVTDYPFEETIRFEVEPAEPAAFPLHLRIPSWCEAAAVEVNGRPAAEGPAGSVVKLRRRWQRGDRVELRLPMPLTVSRWCKGAAAVERGPLVYGLRIGQRWVGVDDQGKYGNRA
ncbi:MAG: beta-L-arabinofuranosidase domain-containing protein [Planctomycetota bacterium]